MTAGLLTHGNQNISLPIKTSFTVTCGLLTTQGYSASAYSCGGSYGIELNNSHHIPIHIQKCNEMLSKATLTAIVNEVNRMNK
ncbi:protein of unknown function [Citrobacter freundii]|nr:protein of unknown function [Citrobacter freundii]